MIDTKKEFKNYKEKQNFYRERAKQTTMRWVSKSAIDYKKNSIIKGRTFKGGFKDDK